MRHSVKEKKFERNQPHTLVGIPVALFAGARHAQVVQAAFAPQESQPVVVGIAVDDTVNRLPVAEKAPKAAPPEIGGCVTACIIGAGASGLFAFATYTGITAMLAAASIMPDMVVGTVFVAAVTVVMLAMLVGSAVNMAKDCKSYNKENSLFHTDSEILNKAKDSTVQAEPVKVF